MPVFNGERHLPKTLDSLTQQTGEADWELVVVDDGSTDGSRELVASYADRLRLRLFARPHSGNWVQQTNFGLDQISAAYACLLHQDDLWEPRRASILKEAVTAYPDTDFWLHSAWFLNDAGHRLGNWRCPLPADRDLAARDLLPRLAAQNFIALPAPCFKTALAKRAGPLDEQLWYFADWEFWIRLAARGSTRYDPRPLAGYRIHPASQTSQRTRNIPEIRRQFQIVSSRLFQQAGWGSGSDRRSAQRLNAFAEVGYHALLAKYHGGSVPWGELWRTGWLLGPAGGWRYLRDSRLVERVLARRRMNKAM